jgi:hypothetical protein
MQEGPGTGSNQYTQSNLLRLSVSMRASSPDMERPATLNGAAFNSGVGEEDKRIGPPANSLGGP